MKFSNYLFLPVTLLLMLFMASCSETSEVSRYDNWRERNENFIDSLEHVYATEIDHGDLDSIHLVSDPSGVIYFKKKTPVAPQGHSPIIKDETPLFNDKIEVFYKGTNILGEYFDGNFKDQNPTFEFSSPSIFLLNEMIIGWYEVIQRMKVGERYEIYIPSEYGYGKIDKGTILPYSTLIFDVQLINIVDAEK